jgi:hypothetical protein
MTKGEKTTLWIVGGIVAFLMIQHRRAVAGSAPHPAPPSPALPGLSIPAQFTT